LLLEGEAGVGKAELGKALAAMLGRPLIRLQFYEGLGRRSLQILARRSELGTVRSSVSASGRRADLS
jgi:ATP-dependent Clp protease ATP-binding subunit ClpA